MSRHTIIITICVLLCVGMCAGVFVQQQQLKDLRTEQQRQAQLTAQPPAEAPVPSPAPSVASPDTSELLRLRSQVGQLMERKRALAAVRGENDRLRTSLTNRGTNSATGVALPPGYIRKSEAQWVGLGSPENTLQSFLWAIQNKDLTNFMQVLTPEMAAKFLRDQHGSAEKIFEGSIGLPGMRLLSQETQPDGSIKAKFEIIPGQSMGEDTIQFRQINGEWKMDMR